MQNRNEAHFKNVPGNYIPHSIFDLSHDVLTSFNVGELIPLTEPIEILPTDSFEIGVASKVYLNTLIFPIMDDLYMDILTFYVPNRIVWDHYPQFEGENDTTPWTQETTYYTPQITSPAGGWSVGTLADYMGVPTGVEFNGTDNEHSISALQFRGYTKIVKDWWYNENVQYPPDLLTDDATIAGSNGDNYITDLIKGGKPFIVGKYKDKFTSCLPAPQKGDSVLLPLGDVDFQSGTIPVFFGHGLDNYTGHDFSAKRFPITFSEIKEGDDPPTWYHPTSNSANLKYLNVSSLPTPWAISQAAGHDSYNEGVSPMVAINNAYADLSDISSSLTSNATINDLRLAFQTQRLFELMARGGTRYYEILASQWGVSAPSGLIQRSELLGQHRFNLKVHTSVQNSATDSESPQANLAGYSITTNYHLQCRKAFTERGYLFILGCVRYHHSYSQGIPKSFKRKDKFDYYQNAFAHIGEQPVFNYEIYAQGTDVDNEVFGYNEYGIDYKFKPNLITGQMRPTFAQTLDYMHLGDKFNQLPTLTSGFIREDKANVDRVIAATTESGANQIRANFHFEIKAMRPMPLYNVPGLIDHL